MIMTERSEEKPSTKEKKLNLTYWGYLDQPGNEGNESLKPSSRPLVSTMETALLSRIQRFKPLSRITPLKAESHHAHLLIHATPVVHFLCSFLPPRIYTHLFMADQTNFPLLSLFWLCWRYYSIELIACSIKGCKTNQKAPIFLELLCHQIILSAVCRMQMFWEKMEEEKLWHAQDIFICENMFLMIWQRKHHTDTRGQARTAGCMLHLWITETFHFTFD